MNPTTRRFFPRLFVCVGFMLLALMGCKTPIAEPPEAAPKESEKELAADKQSAPSEAPKTEESMNLGEQAKRPIDKKSVKAIGDAAFKAVLPAPGSPALATLQAYLDATFPGTSWVITQQAFVVERWSFFEVASADAMDLPSERFVVDAQDGVVAKGDLQVLGAIFKTLDVLGNGKTKAFNLARIAASIHRSQGSVLDALTLEGLSPQLAEPSFSKNGKTATLVYFEQQLGRGLSFTRCQLELAKDYTVSSVCEPFSP
ncbi:MAG: hypothetical protein RBU37_11135 [Myxococcota bacterium]|jgi:hypothetical protein|nr:hypothetical protein [Myxococcota bacterium]